MSIKKHPFPPIFSGSSRILVLGSFPSVRSREEGFYYAHPRNRFWPMLERVFSCSLQSMEQKCTLLHEKHIALWDSIASCSIEGSADSAIEDFKANDIPWLLGKTEITSILANGSKAYDVYMDLIFPETGIMATRLPSTSPANASWSLERLVSAWKPFLAAAGTYPKHAHDAIMEP